jgi:hypothetical protein
VSHRATPRVGLSLSLEKPAVRARWNVAPHPRVVLLES